jgi:hypothetical protein
MALFTFAVVACASLAAAQQPSATPGGWWFVATGRSARFCMRQHCSLIANKWCVCSSVAILTRERCRRRSGEDWTRQRQHRFSSLRGQRLLASTSPPPYEATRLRGTWVDGGGKPQRHAAPATQRVSSGASFPRRALREPPGALLAARRGIARLALPQLSLPLAADPFHRAE